jgi:hypothetical protein
MKILAVISKNHRTRYIADISHEEIEKVFNKYYNKLGELKVDQEIDLGEGYNYTSDIQQTCESMTKSMERFDNTRKMLLTFASIIDNASIRE